MARYDRIGHGYTHTRAEDPALAERIARALGDASSVVNVGAGAGAYEPLDRTVLAVEPSRVMAGQRPVGRPAVRGVATELPLHDASVDAAMTVLSLHHWFPDARLGVEEMARVSRGPVVIVTIDAQRSGRMWLMADYLTEVRDLDHQIFPPPEEIAGWLDRPAQIETVPVPRDTPDHHLLSFWAHPERVLDAAARQATSGFARQTEAVQQRVVDDVRRDLESGAWDERHGALRELEELDCGMRLVRFD